MPLPDDLQPYRQRVNQALEQHLPSTNTPLAQAMRHGVQNGGKRIRPLLVYGAGLAFGVPLSILDFPACAVELVHSYSLIHDDLPAMDNSDWRRGKPTCHTLFGDAVAILAGNSLQTLAFEILAEPLPGLKPGQQLDLIRTLAVSCGNKGLAEGQAIDLAATGQSLSLAALEQMHRLKTGALIRASLILGARCCETVTSAQLTQLTIFADCLGLAFQIRDDILDIESSTELLGKPQGIDKALGKVTYPALLGLEEAKAKAAELEKIARGVLRELPGDIEVLRGVMGYLVARKR
jgi:farnesyl diphosphate synthase